MSDETIATANSAQDLVAAIGRVLISVPFIWAAFHSPSMTIIAVAHDPVTLLFLLLAAHALGDFAFQSRFLAMAKNRHSEIGRDYWIAALPAHALIHGVLVFAITGSTGLGLAETALHGVIDGCKNEGWFGFRTDQALHVLCKILWLFLVLYPRFA